MSGWRPVAVAAVSGVVFGGGLALAGMTRPAKVIAFLDLGGDWDPSLAFVMIGAIGVHAVAWLLLRRIGKPWAALRWHTPERRDVDGALVGGAVLFGVGWGLSGYCPGPAVSSLGAGAPSAVWMVVGMALGMAAWSRLRVRVG